MSGPGAADALEPALDAAEARWQAVGQPAADNLNHSITRIENDIERDELARLRRRVVSLLGPTPDRADVPEAPRLDDPGRSTNDLGL